MPGDIHTPELTPTFILNRDQYRSQLQIQFLKAKFENNGNVDPHHLTQENKESLLQKCSVWVELFLDYFLHPATAAYYNYARIHEIIGSLPLEEDPDFNLLAQIVGIPEAKVKVFLKLLNRIWAVRQLEELRISEASCPHNIATIHSQLKTLDTQKV